MTKGRGFSCLASTLAPFLLLEGRGFPGERGRVWLCWSLPPSVPPSEASLLFSGEPLTPASEAAPLLVRCCCLFSSWLIYHACFGKHGYIHTQQQRCQNSHLLSLAGFSLEGWYSWRASACLPTGLWSQELWPRALCRAVSWTLGSPPQGRKLYLLASGCGEPLYLWGDAGPSSLVCRSLSWSQIPQTLEKTLVPSNPSSRPFTKLSAVCPSPTAASSWARRVGVEPCGGAGRGQVHSPLQVNPACLFFPSNTLSQSPASVDTWWLSLTF